ncbi:MAG: HEAT repeat domain-containing protein, partial [Planctomycetota bacterium]
MRREIMLPVITAGPVLAVCTAVVLLVVIPEGPRPVPPQTAEPTTTSDVGPVPEPDAEDPHREPREEASTKPAPVEVAEPPAVEPVYEGRPMSFWIGQLRAGDRRARWKALVAFHNVPYDAEAALPLIMGIGRSDDTVLRAAAARALGSYGRKAARAVPLLEDLARDPVSLMVRRPAVVALGRTGAGVESAVALLVPLLSDHRRHCQPQAADALAQMGERGLGELVAHVEESFGI